MLSVRWWSDAGPTGMGGQGQVLASTVQSSEPKTGQQKVELYYEDDPLCHLVILFI